MGPCFLIFNVPSVTTTRALSLNPRARSIWRPKTNSLLKSNQRRAKQTHHHHHQLIIDLEEERSVEGKGNSICKHAYIHDNWILSLLWTLSFLLVKKEERRNGKNTPNWISCTSTSRNHSPMSVYLSFQFAFVCSLCFSVCEQSQVFHFQSVLNLFAHPQWKSFWKHVFKKQQKFTAEALQTWPEAISVCVCVCACIYERCRGNGMGEFIMSNQIDSISSEQRHTSIQNRARVACDKWVPVMNDVGNLVRPFTA